MKSKSMLPVIFVIILLSNLVFAQNFSEVTCSRISAAKKQIYPDKTFDFFSSIEDYGFGINSSNVQVITRSIYWLTIPTNIGADAQIYSVKLKYNTGTTVGGFNIYNVAAISSPDSKQTWEHVDTGSYIDSFSPSQSTLTVEMPYSFVQTVNGYLASNNRNIYLGIRSAIEGSSTSFSQISNFTITFYYHRAVSFTVRNSFSDGILKVNDASVTSGATVNSHEQLTVTLEAIEPQTSSGTTYRWNDTEAPSNKSKWERIKGSTTANKGESQRITPTMSYNDDNGSEYKAILRKVCNVTFQNSFVGLSSRGTMTISGNSVTLPTGAYEVIEGNTINASATYYQENGINYYFRRWEDNSTDPNRTLTINQNSVTATAYFEGIPSTGNRNLTYETIVGQPITLHWTGHPNTYVTKYAIWRKIKNGQAGSVIAEVNRGTTTFVDNDYSYVASNAPVTLQYDVMPYYSLENTYSYADWLTIGGEFLPKKNENEAGKMGLPTSYAISNHPNPFNPTTSLNYQLPQDGMVTIKVYDIIGKEVATLVNEQKSAGYYKVDFDASRLTSGVYIATIQASGFNKSIKLLLTK